MTPDQIQKFKTKAKVYKMTLQDYINWLTLFKEDPQDLTPRNYANLQKLVRGLPMSLNDVPRESVPPPLTAEQYFEQISMMDERLHPRNTNTGGLQIPANYMDYSTFEAPRVLKHLNEYDQKTDLNKYQHREAIFNTRPAISHGMDN